MAILSTLVHLSTVLETCVFQVHAPTRVSNDVAVIAFDNGWSMVVANLLRSVRLDCSQIACYFA